MKFPDMRVRICPFLPAEGRWSAAAIVDCALKLHKGRRGSRRACLGAQDYVGCHVGPEPTTDRFIACCYGKEKEVIQGNAISVDRDLPYNGLTRFGQ
eukprot:11510372-Prorocentrum_lima.AAC.1